MPRVKITPNQTYHPGHIGGLISQIAPGPMVVDKDGTVTVKLTDSQLEEFSRRGGACHKVEVLPDLDPTVAVANTEPAAGPETAATAATAATRNPKIKVSGDNCYFMCPGCKETHRVPTAGSVKWSWNGSVDKPSFHPSLLINQGEADCCHSVITDGKIDFAMDSKHSLSGQTVDLPDWMSPAQIRRETQGGQASTPESFLAACRAMRMSDQQIIDLLVKSGWKESQAIDLVMNDEMPPAA